jgi:hypothetical protein
MVKDLMLQIADGNTVTARLDDDDAGAVIAVENGDRIFGCHVTRAEAIDLMVGLGALINEMQ